VKRSSKRRRHLARSRKAFAFAQSLHGMPQGFAGRQNGGLGAIGSNRLTPDQLSNLAASAGFSGDDLVTAVAVALAESRGDPNAYNPEGSVGLWQIYRPDHPEFDGWDLTDPAKNAAAAFSVYSNAGASFRPWSAFKNGAYQAYLSTAQQGVMLDARNEPWGGDPGANDLPTSTGLPIGTDARNALIVGAVAVGAFYAVRWIFDE
jgi:hypothetical protein